MKTYEKIIALISLIGLVFIIFNIKNIEVKRFDIKQKEDSVNLLNKKLDSISHHLDSLRNIPRKIVYVKAKERIIKEVYNNDTTIHDTTIIKDCNDILTDNKILRLEGDSLENMLSISRLESGILKINNDTLRQTIIVNNNKIKKLDKKLLLYKILSVTAVATAIFL
jgi:hypothetical protein